jgi:hypothetical protein
MSSVSSSSKDNNSSEINHPQYSSSIAIHSAAADFQHGIKIIWKGAPIPLILREIWRGSSVG